jgi:hypothetical protein
LAIELEQHHLIAKLEAVPGYQAMDGSPLSEAIEQLVDEVAEYGTRPSAERMQAFRAENIGVNIMQGGVHAADIKPMSVRAKEVSGGSLEVYDGHLEVTDKKSAGAVQEVKIDGEVTIGRVATNQICVPRGNVSKRHARLLAKDGVVVLVDLKSTNGTYVNGKRINGPTVLTPDDVVTLGDIQMRLVNDPTKT